MDFAAVDTNRIAKAIEDNLDFLCENSKNLEKLLLLLFSSGAIHTNAWHEIRSFPSNQTRFQELYKLVVKKVKAGNMKEYNCLLNELRASGNDHIVTKLEEYKNKEEQENQNELNSTFESVSIFITEDNSDTSKQPFTSGSGNIFNESVWLHC